MLFLKRLVGGVALTAALVVAFARGVAAGWGLPTRIWARLMRIFRPRLSDDWLARHGGPTADDPPFPPVPPLTKPPTDPAPSDFWIRIQAGAVMATARKQELTIGPAGRAFSTTADRLGDPDPVQHEFYLDDDTLRYLVDELRDDDVFTASGLNGGGVDGDFLVVSVRLEQRENTVSLFNAYDPAVTRFMQIVNGVVPETMRVLYSQLDGPPPSEAEALS